MNHSAGIPSLTTAQMIEVDRAMVEDLGISLIQMMENAGRHLAHLARMRFLDGDPHGHRVVILAGTGGNGGGALVAARRLHGWGADVQVVVTAEDAAYTPVPGQQLGIVRRMGIPVARAVVAAAEAPSVILDGLLGYSLHGAPRGSAADLIRWSNTQAAPVLSLDVPSGMDAGTGEVFDPAVVATATLTLAYPKAGLRVPRAAEHVGELYLADIGVPPTLTPGLSPGALIGPLFAREEIIRLE